MTTTTEMPSPAGGGAPAGGASPIEKANPGARRRKKMSMERVMLLFTLFFAGGIGMLVLFPEEHPARAFAMAGYSIAMFWTLYRFAV